MQGGGSIGISSEGNSEEEIAAAWEFVKFLMSDEQVAANHIETGVLPTTYSAVEGDTLQGFLSLLVLEGEGVLTGGGQRLELKAGDSVYLPKGMEAYRAEGNLQLLISSGGLRQKRETDGSPGNI